MAATREQVTEMVMKIFDRLESDEFSGSKIEDAMVLVELSTPPDLDDELGDGDQTVIILESTTDRVTVQDGILDFAKHNLVGADAEYE